MIPLWQMMVFQPKIAIRIIQLENIWTWCQLTFFFCCLEECDFWSCCKCFLFFRGTFQKKFIIFFAAPGKVSRSSQRWENTWRLDQWHVPLLHHNPTTPAAMTPMKVWTNCLDYLDSCTASVKLRNHDVLVFTSRIHNEFTSQIGWFLRILLAS